jgi:Ca-activated chloride channel homolog
MIPPDLHYAFPEAFYLFPVGILLVFFFWSLIRYRNAFLERFFGPEVIPDILVPRSRYHRLGKPVSCFAVWMFAMLALMQPKGNGRYPLESGLQEGERGEDRKQEAVVRRKAHDVIFLVDASASMSVRDTRIGVTRLEYAKEIVDEIVSRMKGESVALYAYTSDTTRLSPPTMDYLFVRLVLRDVVINEGDLAGTNILEALSDMKDAYFQNPDPKLKTLVILSDGGDNHLDGLEGEARRVQIDMMLSILDKANEHHLRVFSVGLGSEQGKPIPDIEYRGRPVVSSLDEELLKALSEKGRGVYYFSNQWTAMDLASDLVEKMGEDDPRFEEFTMDRSSGITRGKEDLVYDLFFQFPLGLAIFTLLWMLFLPESERRK